MRISPRLLAYLAFAAVCAMLLFAPAAFAAKPYNTTADYYTCEFLGHCPDTPVDYVPEMWDVVKCYEQVGKHCPKEPARKQ